MYYVDSVQLTGEGDYNLNSIKYEEVTESFLGLNQAVRGCQNEEQYDECTTRHYIENMKDKCGCLPLSIALSDQVSVSFFFFNDKPKSKSQVKEKIQIPGLLPVDYKSGLPF